MAKATRKPEKKEPPAKPRVKPIKKNIAVQAAEEVLQEIKAEEKPEVKPGVRITAVPDAPPVVDPLPVVKKRTPFYEQIFATISKSMHKAAMLYVIGGMIAFVLFLLLKGCNHNERIVKQNDKTIAPYQQELDRLRQERKTMEDKARDDSVMHLENERLKAELRKIETELSAYLQQQKKSSDERKTVIHNGTDHQLDSLWDRIKFAKGLVH